MFLITDLMAFSGIAVHTVWRNCIIYILAVHWDWMALISSDMGALLL